MHTNNLGKGEGRGVDGHDLEPQLVHVQILEFIRALVVCRLEEGGGE